MPFHRYAVSSLAPVVTPLEKFKAQYPDSALIADLVSVHEGQYVVRAAVMRKGETLSTGLAAHVDVQIAEDNARNRAIAALGIVIMPITPPTGNGSTPLAQLPAETQSVETQSVVERKTALPSSVTGASVTGASVTGNSGTSGASGTSGILDIPAVPSLTVAYADIAQPEAAVKGERFSDAEYSHSAYLNADLPPEEDLGRPIDAIEEGAVEITTPAKPSAAAIALENFNASANPVDLSDVIAQTDVELTRLGWTSAQGREYLEQTYGKRSRQQLTDEELMSFLLHLEDL